MGLCQIVKRSLLQITIGENTFYALNEVAIQRDNSLVSAAATQILTVEVTAKEGKDQIAGDGLLICTPTGSTAYSLSAGGAILTPEVPVFMMTPICAFSMRARPIVFSDTEEFKITVKKGKSIVLTDGGVIAALPENVEILIKKAPFTADFPVKENSDFFARVRNKLNG
jgi:NAD+ kinase